VRLYKKQHLLYRLHEVFCRRRNFDVVKPYIVIVAAAMATIGQVKGKISSSNADKHETCYQS
jgi:hypothetical protein